MPEVQPESQAGCYKFVYIPADTSEPLQELEQSFTNRDDSRVDSELQSLINTVKAHFAAIKGPKTAQQKEAQRQQFLHNMGGADASDPKVAASINAAMEAANDLNMVENVALLANAKDTGFVGVNLYCDDEAGIMGAQANLRASDIANCCGKPLEVKGDAFLARVYDNGEDFKRMDFRLPEVSSSAQWVKDAATQNKRKRAAGNPDNIVARLQSKPPVQGKLPGSSTGGASAAAGSSSRANGLALPTAVKPEDEAKEQGNAALKQGDYDQAVRLYSKALEHNCRLAAAYNNRALAHLKLSNLADAEADCDYVLMLEPKNVKALLRRGSAREAQGKLREAISDFEQVRVLEPTNKDAQNKLRHAQKTLDETSEAV
eukprot:jgi/Astpho2/2514/Aster-04231